MKIDKDTVIFIAIVLTAGLIFICIPHFVNNDTVASLLIRLNAYQGYDQNKDVVATPKEDENNNIFDNLFHNDNSFNTTDDNTSSNSSTNNSTNNNNTSSGGSTTNNSTNNNSTNSGTSSNTTNNNNTDNNTNNNTTNNNTNNNSGYNTNNNNTNNNSTPVSQTFTATFNANGVDSVTQSTTSCSTTTGSCNITTPTMSSSKEVLGWSSNANGTSAEYGVGQLVTINSNCNYYAISKKDVVFNVYGNGAFEGSKVLNCTMYNTANTCGMTLPTLDKDIYTTIGFHTNSESTTIMYGNGSQVDANSNMNLYGIRKIDTTNYDAYASIASEVFNDINALRTSKGLGTLKHSESLELSAMVRVSEVEQNYDYNVNGDYHYRISNAQPFYTVNTMAYGENYDAGTCSADYFQNQFVNSPTHYANMVRTDINTLGIAVSKYNNECYIVELFGISS